MMLAATYTQGGAFNVCEVPEPRIANGEILLRVTASAICGTDIKIMRNGHRKLTDGQRIILGHEFVGVIEKLGAGVSGYRVGQRIGVAPNAGCGACDACRRGLSNYCPTYTAFGIDFDGAHARHVRIPAKFIQQGNVIPLPDSLSDKHAALLEPLSCVVAGSLASKIRLGDIVAIYGAGPIGLLHLQLAKISGAARLIMIDPQAKRLELAKRLGANVAIAPDKEDAVKRVMEETEGRGAVVVITACPVPAVQEESLKVVAAFGRICLFGGLPRGKDAISFDSNAVHYKNLCVTGSTGGSVHDYVTSLRLAANGRLALDPLISDVFGIDEVEAAYAKAAAGAEGKVVMLDK